MVLAPVQGEYRFCLITRHICVYADMDHPPTDAFKGI